MAHYTYSAHAKAALRKAITSHPQWPDYSRLTGLSSANLNIDAMEAIAAIFENPKIDLTEYGTTGKQRRSWSRNPNAQPVPKPISPETVAALEAGLVLYKEAIKPYRYGFACGVLDTIKTKQNGWASEAQAKALQDIIAEGEAAVNGSAPAAAPQPQPIFTQNTSIPSTPAPSANTVPDDKAALIAKLLELLGTGTTVAAPLDEQRIIDLIKTHAGQPSTMRIDLTPAAQLPPIDQLAHHKLPLLVAAMQAGVNVMLVGEAGSGKTKATEQAAQLLGRSYAFSGAVDSPYKLTGFIDAQGRAVRTPFRDAVEKGWAFCMDEIDGCLPSAVLPINAVASNRMADFPDGIVKAHPDFCLVACANTYGKGSDRLYVGRHQQDSAVLDRYAVLDWNIDSRVEAGMLGLPAPANAPKPYSISPITDAKALDDLAQQWLRSVQNMRAAVQKHKLRHIISPRASQMGLKLLAAGWPWPEVMDACIYKGLDADSRAKLV